MVPVHMALRTAWYRASSPAPCAVFSRNRYDCRNRFWPPGQKFVAPTHPFPLVQVLSLDGRLHTDRAWLYVPLLSRVRCGPASSAFHMLRTPCSSAPHRPTGAVSCFASAVVHSVCSCGFSVFLRGPSLVHIEPSSVHRHTCISSHALCRAFPHLLVICSWPRDAATSPAVMPSFGRVGDGPAVMPSSAGGPPMYTR